MHCTHCGNVTQQNPRIFRFERADKKLQLHLCDDCVDELLANTQVEMTDQ